MRINSHLFHLGLKRGPFESKPGCSPSRTADSAFRAPKCVKDVLTLNGREGLNGNISPIIPDSIVGIQHTQRCAEYRTIRENDGTLDEIFEFPNVAGPFPIL